MVWLDGQIWKNYVQVGGRRVAVRVYTAATSEVTFILSDHLGSTSMTIHNDGTLRSEIRYTAYGEDRSNTGDTPTNYRYTGQLSQRETVGLYFYNARWYDPYLNRFLSPDNIVPNPYNPLDWDRYAYVRNNPINRVDPDGHRSCTDMDENGNCASFEPLERYHVKFTSAGIQAYLLYLKAKNDSGKWWNKDHPITPAEYLGLETLWERSDVPGIEELLIEASTRQLWMEEGIAPSGSRRGNHPYCQGTSCTVGMWNFIGEFAGGHPASRFDTEPTPYPYLFPGENEKSIIYPTSIKAPILNGQDQVQPSMTLD